MKRVRKPSAHVKELSSGEGLTSARPSDPKVPKGIILPSKSTAPVLEGEGMADWMMVVDWIDEYTMAAEISEVEALKPRSLSEAK